MAAHLYPFRSSALTNTTLDSHNRYDNVKDFTAARKEQRLRSIDRRRCFRFFVGFLVILGEARIRAAVTNSTEVANVVVAAASHAGRMPFTIILRAVSATEDAWIKLVRHNCVGSQCIAWLA